MAPSKTSRTPRPATRSKPVGVSRTPSSASKRPSLTNKSILSFFQKVDRSEEEGLFVADGSAAGFTAPKTSVKAEDDIYGGHDDNDEGGAILEERFNEAEGPSKRRKLSVDPDEEAKASVSSGLVAVEEEEDGVTPVNQKLSQVKKPRRGPFLDDSDSDEDDPLPPPADVLKEDVPEDPAPAKEPPQDDEVQHPWETPPDTVPPPMLRQATSNTITKEDTEDPPGPDDEEEFGDLEAFDDEDFGEGEEFREMRFAKEQARLEAEEAGNYTSFDEGFQTPMEDKSRTESCPICGSSLEGVTPDDATVHVNSCLDGNPTPLPKRTKPSTPPPLVKQESVPGAEVGKRFARAAVARPGQANPFSLGDGDSGSNAGQSNSAFTKLMSGHAEDAAWANAAAAENAARGRPAYERTCPFYKIMPGFFICVDAFRYGAVKGCRAYFLSHFHSDHYVGLTANWTHGPIYCSNVTGSLVKTQLRVDPKYVVELDFEKTVPVPGTEGVSVTMIPANHCPGSSLFLFEKQVRSPNSNANSKERRVQRILHCGDFRACAAHVTHPQLKPETVDALGKIRQQKIDVCYLDTTYLNPRYSFPPQEDVIRACAELCFELNEALAEEDEARWDRILRRRGGAGGDAAGNDTVSRFFVAADKKPSASSKSSDDPSQPPPPDNAFTALGKPPPTNRNRLLVVCGTYSIGKERICKAIAQRLGSRIFATPAKIRICRQLGDPELSALMTSDPAAAQVHMQSLFELRPDTLAEYLDSYHAHFGRVVGFRPSGWNYRPSAATGGNGPVGGAAAITATASLPPTTLPTAQLLHGATWRPRLRARDLVPQRGSTRASMCFGVPYSEHSSFRELALFVMGLRIERVVPTVNVGSEASRKRMRGWTDRWLAERRRGGLVRVVDEDDGDEGVEAEDCDEQDAVERKGAAPVKKEKEVPMWDGKDGRGGGVYW
ncbi:DNA repair metallo-beta-lactamase [Pleurostoma richardsiae]|uniref:DNA repair metallo-beta-lactamase n=1 Tax=Pleurostoma richardsiae TaxID=41990 RepID=A0AA38RPQ8_9PEZI|nr:DNA repair metallo-beta-lactamase [Pleurostoma richardsiae]